MRIKENLEMYDKCVFDTSYKEIPIVKHNQNIMVTFERCSYYRFF